LCIISDSIPAVVQLLILIQLLILPRWTKMPAKRTLGVLQGLRGRRIFPRSSPNLPCSFPQCSLNLPQISPEASSLNVHRSFPESSRNIPWVSPNVPWTFPEPSPNCIPQGELDALALKYPSLKIRYSLTSPTPEELRGSRILGKINKALMAEHLPPPGETTFVSWCVKPTNQRLNPKPLTLNPKTYIMKMSIVPLGPVGCRRLSSRRANEIFNPI
jgi:hypothetical protein